MISKRDKKIIKFMESTNLGLTINQAALMFFPQSFSYDYARTRLRNRWEKNILKRYTNDYTGELIYYLEDTAKPTKKPSFHDNAVLNVYANFINLGYKITEFKTNKEWAEGVIKSDAFFIVENEDEKRLIIVEIDVTHPTNLSKYEDLYEIGEIQELYNGVFPMVLILSAVDRSYTSENFAVVNLDIKCTDFRNKVLI